MKKITLHIEYIRELIEQIHVINKLKLEDIEFIEKGVPLDIPPKRIEAFKFIGLNNIDFIKSDFYKDEELEKKLDEKECIHCHTPFTPKEPKDYYCDECAKTYLQCGCKGSCMCYSR